MNSDILYPAAVGMEVEINTVPIPNGIKEGVGEVGLIVDFYTENGIEYFVIDMGHDLELHFSREHFHIIEEP